MYRLDLEDLDVAINPLSLWRQPKRLQRPSEIESRRRVWVVCMFMDACVGSISSMPLIIDCTRYLYTLTPNPLPPIVEESDIFGEEQWRKMLNEGVKYSLFQKPACSEIEMVKDRDGWTMVFQLSFLLRRITRFNYLTSVRQWAATSPSSGTDTELRAWPLKMIIPRGEDVNVLHKALIEFHNTFPKEFKLFDSLYEFEENDCRLQKNFDINRPITIYCGFLFLTALAMLHLPYADQGQTFPCDYSREDTSKLTSTRIVLIARKVQDELLKRVIQIDFDRKSEGEKALYGGKVVMSDPFSLVMMSDPFYCFQIFTIAAISLAVAGFSNAESSKTVKEIVADVHYTNLPVSLFLPCF
jgi:hypothetical protein